MFKSSVFFPGERAAGAGIRGEGRNDAEAIKATDSARRGAQRRWDRSRSVLQSRRGVDRQQAVFRWKDAISGSDWVEAGWSRLGYGPWALVRRCKATAKDVGGSVSGGEWTGGI